MALKVSPKIRQKLWEEHHVDIDEVEQCFANRRGVYLEDKREQHMSDPPTQWFVAETDRGRRLKIVFVQKPGSAENSTDIYIRTAYDSNPEEERIYTKYSDQT